MAEARVQTPTSANRPGDTEASYSLVFEAALDCIITMDADGRIVGFNSAAEATFGYARERAIGQTLADLLIPERLRDLHRAGLANYLRTGRAAIFDRRLEMPALRADGSEFPVELSVVALRPHGAHYPLFVGFLRDITGRRRAEEALRSSEEKFRTLADCAPVLIWMSGPDQKCTWFNKPWLEFTGRTLEQELGDGWAAGVHPEDLEHCLSTYRTAFDRREPFRMEYRLRRHDGQYRWLLDGGIPQHVGQTFTGYVGSCVDITELKGSQQAQAQLAAIVESSDDAMISKTLDGVILTWNAGAERLFGYTAAEAIGRSIWMIIPADRHAEEDDILEKLTHGDEHYDTVRVTKDGRQVDVSITVSPIRDASGRIVGASKVARDISARKRVEDSLREYAGRLTAILSTAVDGIITIDPRGRIESANPAALRLFGYEPHELVGRNVRMLMPEPFHSQHDDYIANYLRTGERKIIGIGREVIGLRKDGSTFPMELAVSETIMGEGRVFTGLVRNITERKLSEQSLREFAGRLAAILDTVVDGIITIDQTGAIESANSAATRLFGYSAEELIGQNVKMLMPEPFHSEHDGYVGAYLATGRRKIIGIGREVVGRRKDGTTFPMDLAVSETRLGDRLIFTGLVRDITGRKAAEQAVRESEEHLRLAVANAPVILCHCDLERRVTWLAKGPQAELPRDLELGLTAEQVLGEQARPLVELQRSVLATGIGARGELTLETSAGARTWDVAVDAIKDPAGELHSLTVVALDITQRKESEDRLHMLLGELNHRVKNTLASVQSIAVQTMAHCASPAEFSQALEARLRSLALTHSLLTRGQWRGADLRAIVTGELSPHAAADSGRVNVSGPALDLTPKAALSLHLVLHELATNAAKYGALSDAAGRVEVRWALQAGPSQPHLRLTWVESGGPRVRPPKRHGFGTLVIEKSVEYEFDGDARLAYEPEGIRFELLIPWSEAVGYVRD